MWTTIRMAMLLSALCFWLWWNASNFDETEHRAIIQIMGTIGGYKGAEWGLRNMVGKKPQQVCSQCGAVVDGE